MDGAAVPPLSRYIWGVDSSEKKGQPISGASNCLLMQDTRFDRKS